MRVLELLRQEKLSSLHILFPTATEAAECKAAGLLMRDSVQFHWTNPGYRDFEDFLATMNHAKRKKHPPGAAQGRGTRDVLPPPRGIARSTTRTGSSSMIATRKTYSQHHSTPYLSLEFFARIGREMPDNVLLGHRRVRRQAAFARRWIFSAGIHVGALLGTSDYMPGLHFEACYYQAIEFCIERRIAAFRRGAQGVHKLARGFLPVAQRSAHAIADPEFARAIGAFLARERAKSRNTVDELERASPFK